MTSKKIKVIVNVLGGVAYPYQVPKDVVLEIRDYDVEGIDNKELNKDLDGGLFKREFHNNIFHEEKNETKN